uniref:Uncharacterized protein n=1 Tax=Octopus bimaculoides TaxID=37653 RepID=A0A0L8FGT7_OCTBM
MMSTGSFRVKWLVITRASICKDIFYNSNNNSYLSMEKYGCTTVKYIGELKFINKQVVEINCTHENERVKKQND